MEIYIHRQNTHTLWRIWWWTSFNSRQQVLVMHQGGDTDVKYSCNLNTVMIESYSSQMPVAAHNRHATNALNALDTLSLSDDHKCLQGHTMGTVPLNDKSSYHEITHKLKDRILMFGFFFISLDISTSFVIKYYYCHQYLQPLESIKWRTASNATDQRKSLPHVPFWRRFTTKTIL